MGFPFLHEYVEKCEEKSVKNFAPNKVTQNCGLLLINKTR